jgi:hypothetical protein
VNFATRLAITGLGLAALGTGVFLARGTDQAPAAATLRFESAQQCRGCHPDVDAEWRGSHHQIAFTNPEVRALSDDFRKEECMDCHLPRPLAVTGFGKRTLPRRTHFDEGVSCITCHLGQDGGVLAARDLPSAPCKPRRSAEFLAVSACESCHNQHQTTDQWRASAWAQKGVHCNDCHMPDVDRHRADGSVRRGRGHVFHGAHDLPTLQQAGTFAAAREGPDLVLSLTNTGAGHNFPTEERHRAVDLVYRFVDAGGTASAWQRAYRFRQPYRDEPGENTQLPAGATKAVRLAIPATAVRAEARLWYRLTPFVGDGDPKSFLLAEREVTW